MELTHKLKQALSACTEGLYVIDETTKQMLYANDALIEDRGAAYAGQPCYSYLCGKASFCECCPELTTAQSVYCWDYFHSQSQRWLIIKNLLIEEDGRLYRVGNVNVIQEMMQLSRAAVGEIHSLQSLLLQHEQRKYLLEWEASHDRMTRLFSRSRFVQDSQELFTDGVFGVLFLDINNLKLVNDTMGHAYGDLMIKKVANTLEGFISPSLRPYRMGGDEFFIVMPEATPEELATFRCALETELEELNRLGGPTCKVAVGTAWGDLSIDALMRQADLDMYVQKQRMKASKE